MKKIGPLFVTLFITNMLVCEIIHVPIHYLTIQQGINNALPGDTILVFPGTYYENLDFLGRPDITLASYYIFSQDQSYISQTIIDGDQAGGSGKH